MVTADITNYFVMSFHVANFSYYIGVMNRTLFGYFSFWKTFFFVEFMKNSLHLAAALFNVSTITQISILLDLEWVHKYGDKVNCTITLCNFDIILIAANYYYFSGNCCITMHYFLFSRICSGELVFLCSKSSNFKFYKFRCIKKYFQCSQEVDLQGTMEDVIFYKN